MPKVFQKAFIGEPSPKEISWKTYPESLLGNLLCWVVKRVWKAGKKKRMYREREKSIKRVCTEKGRGIQEVIDLWRRLGRAMVIKT